VAFSGLLAGFVAGCIGFWKDCWVGWKEAKSAYAYSGMFLSGAIWSSILMLIAAYICGVYVRDGQYIVRFMGDYPQFVSSFERPQAHSDQVATNWTAVPVSCFFKNEYFVCKIV
jgi:hypothetical protein